jgi:hypothetical protein
VIERLTRVIANLSVLVAVAYAAWRLGPTLPLKVHIVALGGFSLLAVIVSAFAVQSLSKLDALKKDLETYKSTRAGRFLGRVTAIRRRIVFAALTVLLGVLLAAIQGQIAHENVFVDVRPVYAIGYVAVAAALLGCLRIISGYLHLDDYSLESKRLIESEQERERALREYGGKFETLATDSGRFIEQPLG